ncbi:hypothetical protein ACH4GE_30450 [Streptomyces tendae]|nr:hypothetical protein [Streptomyces sp. RS2]MCW1098302.1 hypothetical protein [Streptomyces sp. RS2]BET46061.1 hypothetical protein RGQ21_10430 [Kitasatospora aureofaciens]
MHHAPRDMYDAPRTSRTVTPDSTVTPASTEGRGMAQKIEIRPLDKKETTGDSNSQGA